MKACRIQVCNAKVSVIWHDDMSPIAMPKVKCQFLHFRESLNPVPYARNRTNEHTTLTKYLFSRRTRNEEKNSEYNLSLSVVAQYALVPTQIIANWDAKALCHIKYLL